MNANPPLFPSPAVAWDPHPPLNRLRLSPHSHLTHTPLHYNSVVAGIAGRVLYDRALWEEERDREIQQQRLPLQVVDDGSDEWLVERLYRVHGSPYPYRKELHITFMLREKVSSNRAVPHRTVPTHTHTMPTPPAPHYMHHTHHRTSTPLTPTTCHTTSCRVSSIASAIRRSSSPVARPALAARSLSRLVRCSTSHPKKT